MDANVSHAKPFRIGKRDGGGSLRRFSTPKPKGSRLILHPDHPASQEGRSIFRKRVFHASVLPRVLKSGANASKIGKIVTKGKWKGFPIFTLTLEERASCPRSCAVWGRCYGNNMHMAERIIHDDAFEEKLWKELAALNREHPRGFVVRLHVLGDFYDTTYAELWDAALDEFPALRVFGYTAHHPGSDVGSVISEIAYERWDRFAIRFSGLDRPRGAAVVVRHAEETEHLICPAQTGKTECCATCALCWQSDRTIAFLEH